MSALLGKPSTSVECDAACEGDGTAFAGMSVAAQVTPAMSRGGNEFAKATFLPVGELVVDPHASAPPQQTPTAPPIPAAQTKTAEALGWTQHPDSEDHVYKGNEYRLRSEVEEN